MGYHKTPIKKGELGEISKIQEEMDEVMDAWKQDAQVLILCELADMVGAIEHYIQKYHPNINLDDLQKMARMTKSAFAEGTR